MNDLEARFARLLNDSVDADLAGRRQPPPFTAVPRESSRYATTFSRWRTPILAAAIFAVIIAGTAVGLTRTTSQNRSPADRPVATATSPLVSVTPSPSTPPTEPTRKLGSLSIGQIRNTQQVGLLGWALGTTGLARTSDGGVTWTTDPLPKPFPASWVQSVAETPDGELFLGIIKATTVVIIRQPAGTATWNDEPVALTPTWPARSQLFGPPSSTIITPGPDNLVSVVTSLGAGNSTSATSVFISTDGGVSFTENPAGLTDTIDSVAFTSAKNGVAVMGPNRSLVCHTSDGGRTWTPATAANAPGGGGASYGQPTIDSDGVEIPVTITDADFTAHVAFYRSIDGGITFGATAAKPLTIASADDQEGLSLAASGNTHWVLAGRKLYVSEDAGATWTTILSTSLPVGGTLSLASKLQATIVTETGSCTGLKTGCTSETPLYATTDGGHTWQRV